MSKEERNKILKQIFELWPFVKNDADKRGRLMEEYEVVQLDRLAEDSKRNDS